MTGPSVVGNRYHNMCSVVDYIFAPALGGRPLAAPSQILIIASLLSSQSKVETSQRPFPSRQVWLSRIQGSAEACGAA